MTHPSIKFRCSFQRDPWGHHWLAPWWLQFQPRSLLTGSGNGHRNDHIFQGTCYVFSFRFIFWFWKNTRINTSSLLWLEQVEVWLWLMLTVISMMPAQSSVAEKRHHGKHPPALWWIMDHKTRKKHFNRQMISAPLFISIHGKMRVERRFSMTFGWCIYQVFFGAFEG